MFEPLPAEFNFPKAEEAVLAFWKEHRIFERSMEQRTGAPRFVFYEGPPTANGLPHPGHALTRAIKDLFPRYQTMCGKLVERKAGWDTHGLPVEVEVCKELGIHTKEEIEAYGVERFNRKCIESVFRYTREWEQMTRRLGFWVNLEDAYVTFHQSYIESVWWSLKTLFERGLLYQGHKVVWWWAQGGTALSAGEVGEGYRTVQDPSVYVRFPLVRQGAEGSRGQGVQGSRGQGVQGSRGQGAEGRASEGATAVPAVSVEGSGPPFMENLPPDAKISLLVWTTTPWTLISNHFAAVAPDIDYAIVHDKAGDEYFIVAEALVTAVAEKTKRGFSVVARCKGQDLLGRHYEPPFDAYAARLRDKTAKTREGLELALAWRIVPADFVELGTGTGIVHIAPAYGEVDFNLLQDERKRFTDFDAIPLLNAVAPDGTFTDEAPPQYRGRWVKDCDKEIIRELRDRGILLHQETIEHEYPFCPRAENDPLIQYARKSWFVRTSQFKDEFLANNDRIHWLPDHIQEGRFGDFLRNNVDWALSRERFWGTPLPIWVCERTGKMEAIGSLAELMAKPGATDATPEHPQGMWAAKKGEDPSLPDHLRVHKPYIDAWTYDSPFVETEPEAQARGPGAEGPRGQGVQGQTARMRRVPEVIDCWWDAGSMPFAQWGFPHAPGSVETFTQRFPADFISEALDQTRGWFYGLLSISTLLFSDAANEGVDPGGAHASAKWSGLATVRVDGGPEEFAALSAPFPHPYRTCIVLGLMMGEDGLKMSKRKKNYREPSYIFDTYGADAMRWFFFSGQTPWTSIRFQEANIRDAQREFLVRLYNVFSFFNIYANIDGFVPHPSQGSPWRPTAQRGELDRWIISELHRTIRFVREKMDAFENYPATGRLKDFVDALSNWYVRRSRDRFWRSEKDQDKWDAYHTLYGVLWTLSQLIAPFTPFFAETMYRNLTEASTGAPESAPQVARHGGQSPPCTPAPGPLVPPAPGPLGPSAPRPLGPLSVHLCDYPAADDSLIDEALAAEMDLVRDIVSLGRAARTAAKLKVRQPLALVEIILTRREHAAWLEDHAALIAEELNIKRVEFSTAAEQYVTYQIAPNFKALGPKFGKLAPQVAAALSQLDPAEARQSLEATGRVTISVDTQVFQLTDQEVTIRLEARPGWSAAQGRAGVVVVKTELTEELKQEGLCRELIHHVQSLRKEHDLPYQARIELFVDGPPAIGELAARFGETIRGECLAQSIHIGPVPADASPHRVKIEEHAVTLGLRQT